MMMSFWEQTPVLRVQSHTHSQNAVHNCLGHSYAVNVNVTL